MAKIILKHLLGVLENIRRFSEYKLICRQQIRLIGFVEFWHAEMILTDNFTAQYEGVRSIRMYGYVNFVVILLEICHATGNL